MKQKKFYIVWNPKRDNPKMKYYDKDKAIYACREMIKTQPNDEFYVLEVVHHVKASIQIAEDDFLHDFYDGDTLLTKGSIILDKETLKEHRVVYQDRREGALVLAEKAKEDYTIVIKELKKEFK